MRPSLISLLVLIVLGLGAACSETSTEPRIAEPSLSVSSQMDWVAECPIPADYIVTTEQEFFEAQEVASEGDVIGIDGMIGVGQNDFLNSLLVYKPGITITCASPGSGVFTLPGTTTNQTVYIFGAGVTLAHLVIDGSNVYTAVGAREYGGFDAYGWPMSASQLTILGNEIKSGTGLGIWLVGSQGSLVRENLVLGHPDGSRGGIHLQGRGEFTNGIREYPTDNSVISNNRVVAQAPAPPYGDDFLAGLRVRDGTNLQVESNWVEGQWGYSLFATDIRDSQITGNSAYGAQRYGLLIGQTSWTEDHLSSRNLIYRNELSGASLGGVFIDSGCENTFRANQLQNSGSPLEFVLGEFTGNNSYLGNPNIVTDLGAFDCDGDGVQDPNKVNGPFKDR